LNPLTLGIVTTLAVVGVMLTGSFIYWSLRAREANRAQEISRRLGTLGHEPETADLFHSSGPDPFAQGLGFAGAHLEALVQQAGAPFPVRVLAIRTGIAALIGIGIGGILFGPLGAALGLVLGAGPYMHTRSRARARNIAVSEQLPDALDLIGRSLQAGHGISDAFRLVGEEMPVPIARELGQVYEQHNLGREFRECLSELALRNPQNFDIKIFVSSVRLQRETGGNLIEILDNIAATIRARFIFQAKVRSLTAETRMSSIILGALPFVVAGALAWLRPGYLGVLADDALGRQMLLMCGLLFITGVLLMRSMARLEA
jgi:tight adherence protein B